MVTSSKQTDDQERKSRYDKRRDPAIKKLYNSVRWKRARLKQLEKYPLCDDCLSLGLVVAATVVDHIVPHQGDEVKFFDSGGFSSKCKPCHDRKTAQHDGGFGNRKT